LDLVPHPYICLMKKILFPALVLMFAYSCGNSHEEKPAADSVKQDTLAIQYFGDTITSEGAIASTEIMTRIAGKDSMPIKLQGKITAVCQKKGCWMHLDAGNGKMMRVSFKDYAFFVPKNASGKTAVVDGYAYVDTTSVAELRHYAEDGGASKDSIAKITEPEIELSFEADGVMIRD
jgi:hypothetical protein